MQSINIFNYFKKENYKIKQLIIIINQLIIINIKSNPIFLIQFLTNTFYYFIYALFI